MSVKGFARALGALVGIGLLAVVLFLVLVTAFATVGVPGWMATPVAASAVVPGILAIADVYTPLGNNRRMSVLRQKLPSALAVDFAVTAVVGCVAAFVGSVVLLGPDATSLARTAVVALSVALGYGTFIARNVDVYRGTAPVPDDDEFDPDA